MDTALLSDARRLKTYPAGTTIKGEEPQIYIVVSGKVDEYALEGKSKIAHVATHRAGTPFGLKEFFGAEGHLFRAASEATLFVIPQSGFEQVAAEHPALLRELLKYAYAPESSTPKPPVVTSAEAPAKTDSVKTAPVKTAPAKEPPLPEPVAQKPAPQGPAKGAEGAPTVEVRGALLPEGHKGYPGITHPEYKQLVFKKEVTCPHCGHKFKADKIFQSKLSERQHQRYDLRRFYRDFDMEWYEITTCPACYFSAYFSLFTEPQNFSSIMIKESLPAAKAAVSLNFEGERDMDFVLCAHYIALACTRAFPSYRQLDLRLWSGLSWLYEDIPDEEMMRYAAAKAAGAGAVLYTEGKLGPVQEQQICLTIAGMQHRAGMDEDLNKWLYNAKTMKGGKKAVSDLADRLMDIRREEKQGQ